MADRADKFEPNSNKEIDMLDKHALKGWSKRMESKALSGK
jgi:hypothetical protein